MGGNKRKKESLMVRMVTAQKQVRDLKKLLGVATAGLNKAALHMKHGLPTRGMVWDAEQIRNMLGGTPELEALRDVKTLEYGREVIRWASHFTVNNEAQAEVEEDNAELAEVGEAAAAAAEPAKIIPLNGKVGRGAKVFAGFECGDRTAADELSADRRCGKCVAAGLSDVPEFKCAGCETEVSADADHQCVTCGADAHKHPCCAQCPKPNLDQPLAPAYCAKCGAIEGSADPTFPTHPDDDALCPKCGGETSPF